MSVRRIAEGETGATAAANTVSYAIVTIDRRIASGHPRVAVSSTSGDVAMSEVWPAEISRATFCAHFAQIPLEQALAAGHGQAESVGIFDECNTSMVDRMLIRTLAPYFDRCIRSQGISIDLPPTTLSLPWGG